MSNDVSSMKKMFFLTHDENGTTIRGILLSNSEFFFVEDENYLKSDNDIMYLQAENGYLGDDNNEIDIVQDMKKLEENDLNISGYKMFVHEESEEEKVFYSNGKLDLIDNKQIRNLTKGDFNTLNQTDFNSSAQTQAPSGIQGAQGAAPSGIQGAQGTAEAQVSTQGAAEAQGAAPSGIQGAQGSAQAPGVIEQNKNDLVSFFKSYSAILKKTDDSSNGVMNEISLEDINIANSKIEFLKKRIMNLKHMDKIIPSITPIENINSKTSVKDRIEAANKFIQYFINIINILLNEKIIMKLRALTGEQLAKLIFFDNIKYTDDGKAKFFSKDNLAAILYILLNFFYVKMEIKEKKLEIYIFSNYDRNLFDTQKANYAEIETMFDKLVDIENEGNKQTIIDINPIKEIFLKDKPKKETSMFFIADYIFILKDLINRSKTAIDSEDYDEYFFEAYHYILNNMYNDETINSLYSIIEVINALQINENYKSKSKFNMKLMEYAEENKTKNIITYLKLRNDQERSENNNNSYNRRFKIMYKEEGQLIKTINKIIVEYNDDNIPYYSTKSSDVANEINKELEGDNDFEADFVNNTIVPKVYKKKYVFGEFTDIFLPNLKNKDIASKMSIIKKKLSDETPVPIFMIGYGASGAGKTSSLIYFRGAKEQVDKDGILINLCNQLGEDQTYDTIELNCKEFYHTFNNPIKPGQTDMVVDIVSVPKNEQEKITFSYSNGSFLLGERQNTYSQPDYYFKNEGSPWTYTNNEYELSYPNYGADKMTLTIKKGNISKIKVGARVFGSNIPTNTTVSKVDSDTITLSQEPVMFVYTYNVIFENMSEYNDDSVDGLIAKLKEHGGYVHTTNHIYRLLNRTINKVAEIIHFQEGTPLGEVIIHLIDTDRFVKATTNNPNSSRSHTLVFVKLTKKGDKEKKPANIIIGDFAGVENVFNCDDPDVIMNFLNVKRDEPDKLEKIPYYSTEEYKGNPDPYGNTLTSAPSENPQVKEITSRYIKEKEEIYDFDNDSPPIRKSWNLNQETIALFKKKINNKTLLKIALDLVSDNLSNNEKTGDDRILDLNIQLTTKASSYYSLLNEYYKDYNNLLTKLQEQQNMFNYIKKNLTTKENIVFELDDFEEETIMKPYKLIYNRPTDNIDYFKSIITEQQVEIIKSKGEPNKDIGNIRNRFVDYILFFKTTVKQDGAFVALKQLIPPYPTGFEAPALIQKAEALLVNPKRIALVTTWFSNALNSININPGTIGFVSVDEKSVIHKAIDFFNEWIVKFYNYYQSKENTNTEDFKKDLTKFLTKTSEEAVDNNKNYYLIRNDGTTFNCTFKSILNSITDNKIDNINNLRKNMGLSQINSIFDFIEFKEKNHLEELNDVIRIIEMNINNNPFAYLVISLLLEKTCRLNNSKVICDHRREEGYFINDSLMKVREIIKKILIEKAAIQKSIDVFPNFVDVCFENYCPTGENCFSYDNFENSSKSPGLSSAIFESIFQQLKTSDPEYDVKKMYQEIIVSVFCVFNISKTKTANNPPPIPYLDINDVKSIFYFKGKQIISDDTIRNEFITACEKIISSITPPTSTTVDKSNFNDKLNGLTKMTAIIDNKQQNIIDSFQTKIISQIKELSTQGQKKDTLLNIYDSNLKPIIKLFVDMIDKSNSASAIGTLEFLDQLSKYNKVQTICNVNNNLLQANYDEYIRSFTELYKT